MYSYEERSSLAFGFVIFTFGLRVCILLIRPSGPPEQIVNSAGEHTRVDTRDLIILITGPPKHHTNNESNHQHRRFGYDLCKRLGSGTPWRSGCKSMLNLLSHRPPRFLQTKQTLTSFPPPTTHFCRSQLISS